MKKRMITTKAPVPVAGAREPEPLLTDLRELIIATRQAVARGVNAALVVLHWQIGQRIRKVVLREKRAEHGKEILATVSKELAGGFGRGFSWPNPSRMVALAEAFPDERIVTTLSRHLGWERRRKDLHT
ncbi:MAG: DUF1016 N-terminal domain-containing protein [Verrucomicrobia bacterium]|nr:DUF1016 N-terminal domain-containing protein [Verrucomicrobiota bacterium]